MKFAETCIEMHILEKESRRKEHNRNIDCRYKYTRNTDRRISSVIHINFLLCANRYTISIYSFSSNIVFSIVFMYAHRRMASIVALTVYIRIRISILFSSKYASPKVRYSIHNMSESLIGEILDDRKVYRRISVIRISAKCILTKHQGTT